MMQSFVQKVVEGYIVFLFFDGLLLFSLLRAGEKSRKKARAVFILTLFSAVLWTAYYLIYTSRLPVSMAFLVPAALLITAFLFRRTVFPFQRHCISCGKALSITEFLSSDEHLCASCYDRIHPAQPTIPEEELLRREVEEKKKAWTGWAPENEYVIVFAFDDNGNALLIDDTRMKNRPGKLSGAIGAIGSREENTEAAKRTLLKETGLKCEEPDYTGRLNFEMPDKNIRFHVFVARSFSGALKEGGAKTPVWMPLKKLKYNLMSMDYPLWLPRMLRGQRVEYYAKCNTEGKITEDILDEYAVI